ncbi:TonB-dependent receptor plug domain-containing protein [Gluconacetobacter azotocaptans]|uniref:TonB-dependent receptor n=1 Tax=Gluconacetobacter azotocaptans TaxID=142834 RepID=UPI00195D2E4F|nr:TonB-dependent receptor [Gluconacetobacter azotocaptans]MBM9401903.1 TonB-dependent receptor plug domain-containing protein [Gluconacetobacter azotocaptans]
MTFIRVRRASRAGLLACGCSATLLAPVAPARAQDPVTRAIAPAIDAADQEVITVNGLRRTLTTGHDTTGLFRHSLGFSTYSAGGVSALPVLNGMADDRVATFVDGMRIASACPNHMNPAMSYIDPDAVSTAVAIAGITSVSQGGDSTGGTIEVDRKDPIFARNSKILVTGHARGDYRSNGGGSGASGSVTVANDWLSLRYTGSYSHADDYHAGGGGQRVLSTNYLSFNHAVTLGVRRANHQLALTFGQQDIPYEGFANQYMDMTNNRSTFVNGKYTGDFNWGTLEARGFWQRVDHAMNMLSDKGGHSPTTGMPMNTDTRTAAYSIKATIPLGPRHTLGLGSSFDHNGVNDWWPPLQGSMMMGPGTFHNINDGHRDRLGHYVEWKAQWLPRFSTELGLRSDLVMMNTGPVAPYSWTGMMSMSDAMAARRFNAASRGRTDTNFDVTALLHWHPLDSLMIDGGYARKTRSPNLYERYAWGMGNMATTMIGWFGDGNGYVGNLNLTPEVANTASTTITWHDPVDNAWQVKVQPYYTYTHNYINVVRIGALASGLSKLQFANHNAQSYGINSSAFVRLWKSDAFGTGELHANLNWVRGQDLVTHSGLYHQMPANGAISLHETWRNWTGHVEVTLVKAKSTVDWLRNEPRTPGYALLGLGGTYRWRNLTLDASIENVTNQKYDLPLGGLSLGDYRATGLLGPLPGLGRSFNLSLSAAF